MGLDDAIAADCIAVFAFIARTNHYPDALGYGRVFEDLVRQWRARERTA